MSTSDVEQPSPKDVVLGVAVRPRKRWALIGGVLAGAVHVGMGAAAFALGAPGSAPKKVKPMVVVNHVVDLAPKVEEPPPPKVEEPPPPPPPPPPKVKQPKAKPIPQPPEAKAPPPDVPESEPPPAAEAAQVVAADKAADSQAAFNIATGSGDKFAGGTTSATGTGKEANHTGQVGTGTGTGVNHARPPMLRSRNWPCGWPPEAEDLDVEQAFATIKVSVNPDGSLGDVQVIADPGYGFGRRAVQCARTKVKFDPALDAAGRPIAGTTPPLNVRFTREE
ncbi:MAG: ferric siderophore ABC transporter substrate-binding protein [Polyangiales bacterium]